MVTHTPNPELVAQMDRLRAELKAIPQPVVIPAGMPGPDGARRSYPVLMDAFDLIYCVDGMEPLRTFSAIATHYNRLAAEAGKPHRVRVSDDGNGLIWLDAEARSGG
jgi:hypothetical protein